MQRSPLPHGFLTAPAGGSGLREQTHQTKRGAPGLAFETWESTEAKAGAPGPSHLGTGDSTSPGTARGATISVIRFPRSASIKFTRISLIPVKWPRHPERDIGRASGPGPDANSRRKLAPGAPGPSHLGTGDSTTASWNHAASPAPADRDARRRQLVVLCPFKEEYENKAAQTDENALYPRRMYRKILVSYLWSLISYLLSLTPDP